VTHPLDVERGGWRWLDVASAVTVRATRSVKLFEVWLLDVRLGSLYESERGWISLGAFDLGTEEGGHVYPTRDQAEHAMLVLWMVRYNEVCAEAGARIVLKDWRTGKCSGVSGGEVFGKPTHSHTKRENRSF
jgi:hypothetical protein